jgi:hypothetical protein
VADPVFVHIGPPKTGSTYLQAILWSNRAALKDQGMLVPKRNPVGQFHAAVDLLNHDSKQVGADHTAGLWDALVDEIRSWDGPAVISSENLSLADDDLADHAKLSLETRQIHVIFSARELSRVALEMWQERLKDRADDTWADYLARLGDASDPAAGEFWHQQAGRGLKAWASGLPAEQVHIVTMPDGTPSTLLWERFASVLRIDPASCSTNVPVGADTLGIVESALLRRFNAIASGLDWPAYRAHVKQYLAPHVLARRAGSSRLLTPHDEVALFEEHARQLIGLIDFQGFDVVGDLTDLDPPAPPEVDGAAGRASDEVCDEELLLVAFEAMEGLVAHAEELRRARHSETETTRKVRQELRETRRRLDKLRAVNRRLHLSLDDAETQRGRSAFRGAISRLRLRDRFRRLRHAQDDEC